MSEDLGESFTAQKINKTWNQNQGSFIAVDPRQGEPSSQGGPGTVYVVWRHFFDPDTMVMTRTTDYGNKWSVPKAITGSIPLAKFDQPTISVDAGSADYLTFRSNAFPTAVVTPEGQDGTIFVAWQEKVNIDPLQPDELLEEVLQDENHAFGRPDPNGSPRIVMIRSKDGGNTWKDIYANPAARVAVDFGDRDVPCDDPQYAGLDYHENPCVPPPGFGALPDDRPSGPQVMPWLSIGPDSMALAYYESRGLYDALDPWTEADEGGYTVGIEPYDLTPSTGFISGIERLVDFRAALLDPATGQLLGTSQVSRYPISATAMLNDGEQVSDIAVVSPEECEADPGLEFCQPSLSFHNKPQSGSGGSPFMGDYPGMSPVVQFVYDYDEQNQTGEWRWATEDGDGPYESFHTVFADNRHLVPPIYPPGSPEWLRYSSYGPPGIGGGCLNPGSRNTDVLTARVNANLLLSAPTTYKQLNVRRGFPIRVQNGTGIDRFYHFAISPGNGVASFSADENTDLLTGDVQVYPYSSVSQMVYIDAGAAVPIHVDVSELICNTDNVDNPVHPDNVANECVSCVEEVNAETCQGGSLTFYPDPGHQQIADLGNVETQDPFILNSNVDNPFILNTSETNSSVSNPFILNPFILNPFILNSSVEEVIDTTWEVGTSDATNTASSYLPVINIDNAEQFVGNYGFQLIVHKTSTFAGYDEACMAYNIQQDQILSNVAQDPYDPENPFILNPFILNPFILNESEQNPFILNPFILNPFILNSSFTMAPSDETTQPTESSFSKSLGVAGDGTLRAPRATEVTKMTLRAYRIKPFCDELEEGYDPLTCIERRPICTSGLTPPACILRPCGEGEAPFPNVCEEPVPGYGPDLVFNPGADPPSAAVASSECLQRKFFDNDKNGAAACFKYRAPDLIPEGVDDSSLEDYVKTDGVAPGDTIKFPFGGWDLANRGTTDARPENRELRHGFYLSLFDTVEFDNNGDPTNATLIHTQTSGNPGEVVILADTVVEMPQQNIVIPSVGAETYNLILYVDDLEEVSELDEINNKVLAVVPITINEPNFPPVVTLGGTYSVDEGQEVTFEGSFTDPDLLDEDPTDTHTILWDFGDGTTFEGSDTPTHEVTASHTYTDQGTFTVTLTVTDSYGISDFDTVTVDVLNAAPVPAFEYGPLSETEPVEGQEVTFDARGTTDPGANDTIQYDWDFGDGTTVSSDEAIETHIFGDDGTFTVFLTVTDGDGSSSQMSLDVVVYNVAPTAGPDQTVSTVQGTSINIGLSATDPGVNDIVSFRIDTASVYGGVVLSPGTSRTAVATYEPFPGFCGTDSFVYAVSDDEFNGTSFDTATVTINVVPAYDWVFDGLSSPLNGELYRAKAGSVVPLNWQYVDLNNLTIESADADPSINFKGWPEFKCSENYSGLTPPIEFTLEEDPGSSDIRYSDGAWQFNWQSKYPEGDPKAGDPLPTGCYEIEMTSRYSCGGHFDGPFKVELK
jgi:PKD repeat protein